MGLPTYKRDALQKLRELCEFKDASFSDRAVDEEVTLPSKESEVTEFIKRRTESYFRSWVLPIIDAMIWDDDVARDYLRQVGTD